MIRIDQSCTIFNVIALGLSVIQYDLEFDERNEYVDTLSPLLFFIDFVLAPMDHLPNFDYPRCAYRHALLGHSKLGKKTQSRHLEGNPPFLRVRLCLRAMQIADLPN
jgi:hypothetical protein